MFKKIFLSPFFTPILFLLLWGSFDFIVYHYTNDNILTYTKEGGIIENIAHFGYILLIATLLLVCEDYKDKIKSWGIYLFLALIAFLREAGIHHYLSKTDTTPFKSRFFLNPNNPLGEKIIYGCLLIIILCAVLYIAIKYTKHLITSFFKLNTVTFSIATMCSIGVISKLVDRFPANYRKSHGVALDENLYELMQLMEESSEMFLPYLAILILVQYHLINAKK